MTTSSIHARNRRVLSGAAGLALAAAGLVVVAPSADAAPQPRTYTTVLTTPSSGQATTGVATPYAVKVTNTSAVISGLDHVVLTVPAGFSVTPGTVSAPRQGWTESLNGAGTELTAKTTQPLKYALRKGEFLTMSFTATDNTACDNSLVTWNRKADGIIVDPFVAQGSAPTVQMKPVADRFVITSVTDVSVPTPGNQVVKGDPITVSGDFRCGAALVAPTAQAATLALGKTSAGSPDLGGSLGGTTTATVAAGATSGSIAGATYNQIEAHVGLGVTWSGLGDGFFLDVLGAAVTSDGSVGSTLTVPGGTTTLTNGANGPVSLVVSACDPTTEAATCGDGTQLELTGNFKGLYTNAAPASITWVCTGDGCGHPDNEGSNTNYLYNYDCLGTTCRESSAEPFGEREVEEDFAAFPVFVSLKTATGYTPFAQAQRCVPLPTSSSTTSERYFRLHHTGSIEDSDAQAAGFCVDVNAITRYASGTSGAQTFAGTLRIPVLFVEDPRVRP